MAGAAVLSRDLLDRAGLAVAEGHGGRHADHRVAFGLGAGKGPTKKRRRR